MLNFTHESRILRLEEMKINSEIGYNRARVISGYGPHKMLEMMHQKLLTKLAKEETQEKESDSN